MKVLSNLLTVLAALLNLASGCGLRGTGAGQGLLTLRTALGQQRFGAVSTGGTLTTVGAVLGDSSSGRLISGLTSLGGGTRSGVLTSGASGLGSNSASSGLQTLGALGARLGATSGGGLLSGIGNLAIHSLRRSGSSSTIASGSNIDVSGGNSGLLVQGMQQPGQMLAGGFLATSTSTRSSATSLGVHTGRNTATNVIGLVATPGGGHPGGIASIPGSQPAFGGPSTGQPGAVPGAGTPVRIPGALGGLPGGGLLGGASSSSSVSTSSVSISGGNTIQVSGQPLQQTHPGVGRGSLGGGSIATQLETVSAAQYVGRTAGNVGLADSPNGGGSAGSPSSEVGGLGSARPGSGLADLPGTQPAVVLPRGSGIGVISASSLNEGGSSADSLPSSTNSVSGTGLVDIQGLGQGTHQNGQRLGAAISTVSTSTLRTMSSMGSQMAGRPRGALLGVVPGPTEGVPGGVSAGGSVGPGSRPVRTGTGLVDIEGLGQGTHQNGQRLGAATSTVSTSTLRTMSSIGSQMAGRPTGTLLGVVPGPTEGVPGGLSAVGSVGPGSRPVRTETGLLGVQGHGQSTHPNRQQLGAAISTVATSTLQTTSAMGSQMAGRSTETLLGVVPSPIGGVPIGVSQGGNMGPGTSPAGTGNLPGQGLGQGADQASQSIGGTYIGGSSTIHQSTTQLPGSFPGSGVLPGGIPGQGPLQGTQPVSQMPGGVSRVTVTTSSQSSSSFRSQTHFLRGSPGSAGAGLPSLGGPGSGVGVPMGAPGSGTTGAGVGTESALLNRIVAAAGAGHPQGGPGEVVQGGLGVISSNVRTGSLSTGVVSGVAHPVQRHHRRTPSAAAAAGLALGTVAGALAITAIGTGLASALQNGAAGGGRRIGGCSGGRGCSSGCGRRRRSIPQSKVPAEVLNEIPTNFERLY